MPDQPQPALQPLPALLLNLLPADHSTVGKRKKRYQKNSCLRLLDKGWRQI